MKCRLCGNKNLKEITAREMMYGSRIAFKYEFCIQCESLQIAAMPSPKEIAAAYPSGSYWCPEASQRLKHAGAQALGLRLLDGAFGAGVSARKSLAQRRPRSLCRVFAYGIAPAHRVLDVGCGDGNFLRLIAALGVRECVGVDPFAAASADGSVRIVQTPLPDFAETGFDVVTFHHSLEHVPNPQEMLVEAARRLKVGGRVVVRIPTTSSYAFRSYRADWVQLDAPRHLFIPSRKAMIRLGEDAGLRFELSFDDSTALQFTGSELYKRDLPLRPQDRPADLSATFPAQTLRDFADHAAALNASGDGDQAAFIFVKPA